MCGKSERIASVPQWVASVEKFYLAVLKKYFLENKKRLLQSVLDCCVPRCRLDERVSEPLK